MKKMFFGYLCFWISLIALLFTIGGLTILFLLPPAKIIFQFSMYILIIPVILSLLGGLSYYLQWRLFVTKIVNVGMTINVLVFLLDVYMVYSLYFSI